VKSEDNEAVKFSISYITAREDPRLDWLVDSLERQVHSKDEIELIVVDALGRPAREIGFRSIKTVTRLVETRPKPSIWQGPHRVTAHDFYANANARNTAIALASTDYMCFLDDRCSLDPGWLDVVRRGERKRSSVLCGTYTKRENRGFAVDHRRERELRGKRDCSGGWCFGCNIALPLDWALKINGFEEGCDPVGLEDCVFGHMLSNAGYRLDFVVEMSVQLDRSGPVHPPNFPRQDKGVSPKDKSHALEARFTSRKRTEFTPDLKKLRAELARGGSFPVPDPKADYRDWYDASPLKCASMSIVDRARAAQGG
jgi:hypothetical protein